MIISFVIIYLMLILVIYKLLRVRPTAVNIGVVVMIGVAVVGALVSIWSFSSPLTSRLLVARFVVPIVPQVNGPVTKIHAEGGIPLKGGQDLLLEIQPDIFQNTVDQLTAALEAARRNVDQLKAAAIAADAGVRRADALKGAVDAEFQVATTCSRSESCGGRRADAAASGTKPEGRRCRCGPSESHRRSGQNRFLGS